MSNPIEIAFHDLINPLNSDKLDETLPEFYEQIRMNDESIQKTVALIGHKLQSPLELEALTACHIVEYLMREGSHEIHKHVSMYKFLNDCIRVLSPKYLGKRSTPQVKFRVTELLYCWSEALPHYVKIRDAYMMLRRSNIIKKDPKYNDRIMMKNIAKSERPSYLDENRELLLKSLLASKNPEDHAKANKLIQKLIKEDDEKVERQAKRIEVLDQAIEVSKSLINMVECLPANSDGATLTTSERVKVDEYYVTCTRLRPTVFRMASELDQSESELTNILKANDDLTKAIRLFDVNVGKILHHPDNQKSEGKNGGSDNLLDFGDAPAVQSSSSAAKSNTDILTSSLLDLGLGELVDTSSPSNQGSSSGPSAMDLLMNGASVNGNAVNTASNPAQSTTTAPSPTPSKFVPAQKYTIEQLSLDAQKATTIYQKDNLRCISTPCQNKVCIFTFINGSSQGVSEFQLQLSVTKGTKCHIEDPDRTELGAFNPIMPGPVINQLVYFSATDPAIQIRFRLLFKHGGTSVCETGESMLHLG